MEKKLGEAVENRKRTRGHFGKRRGNGRVPSHFTVVQIFSKKSDLQTTTSSFQHFVEKIVLIMD